MPLSLFLVRALTIIISIKIYGYNRVSYRMDIYIYISCAQETSV